MINNLWKKLSRSKNADSQKENRWKSIGSLSHLQELIQHSVQQQILIFKHSTRCPVSSRTYNQIEASTDVLNKSNIDIYYVDVIAERQLSNDIARVLDITHQSPQAFFIKNSEVAWHASHGQISKESLGKLT